MKRYSEYKDSGVKWIGEIPGHWKLILNGILFHEEIRKPFQNDIPLSLSQKDGLIPSDTLQIQTLKTSSYDNWKRVLKKDLVLNRFKAHLGVLFASNYIGMVSFHYGVYKAKIPLNSKYYEYLFHTNEYKYVYAHSSKGMTVGLQNLSNSDFYAVKSIYPPLPEQEAIVTFLDSKVAKINEYISIAEKKIAALEELKQTIIAEAVTRGIHKDVPMKDSGVKWIGMIPEHWKVNKIRSHFKERRVKVSDKDFQALSVAKIGIVPQLEDACKTDNGDNRKQVLKGDFVVNSRSDRKGSCGISPLDGSVSLINIVLRPFNILQEYVHYLFRSHNYIEEFYRNGRGIVADLWTTRYSEMRNIQIPVPPLPEQQEIVTYIEAKVANINQLCQAERSQIEKLKEYKQRLISDVVTGKVKVTND